MLIFAGYAKRFCRDSRGATMIEYGLIAGLISIVMLGALTAMGTAIEQTFFGAVVDAVNG
nr:Flp family type IVb pilin [Roseibium denhamense]